MLWCGKKSTEKKAPLERFFYKTFFRFGEMDIVANGKSQKTFGKKIVLRVPFFIYFFCGFFQYVFFCIFSLENEQK
jgi:hypothetical protein